MTNIVNTDIETCLSPNVKQYFDNSSTRDISAINLCYLESEVLKMDFDKILHGLGDCSDEDCLTSLLPVFQIIHLDFENYLNINPDAQERIKERTRWTSQPAHVLISSKVHHLDMINNRNDSGIENLLVLSSVLERSLGDVLILQAE